MENSWVTHLSGLCVLMAIIRKTWTDKTLFMSISTQTVTCRPRGKTFLISVPDISRQNKFLICVCVAFFNFFSIVCQVLDSSKKTKTKTKKLGNNFS